MSNGVSEDAVLGDGWGERRAKMTVEEYGTDNWVSGRATGHTEGLEHAERIVRDMATTRFHKGDDTMANAFRAVADHIKTVKDNLK